MGKSTLLRQRYPDARRIDLLKSDELRRYITRPELLRQEIEAEGPDASQQIVIDEVQKAPALLDEVHWLMENRGLHFALCGSSARKVRRGGANLLGGRALRYELSGLTAGELGSDFDLDRMLNHGYLPRMYESSRPRRMLDAYVADYLREEIAAEGLVRNLPAFADFLDAAALRDGEMVNFSNIARECGVSNPTAKGYFGILEDTLLGKWLPAYRKRRKRRLIGSPKFYFADVGVVNRLARRGALSPGSELYGKAFENWVFHELSAFVKLHGRGRQAILLAAAERHRSGFPDRRHRPRDRSKIERQDHTQPSQGTTHPGRRAPKHSAPHGHLPGTPPPPHRGRHRHTPGNDIRK